MTASLVEADEFDANPLDLLEQVASIRDWIFERSHEDELTICVAGEWRDHQISLNWRNDLSGLHVASTLDMRVPPEKRPQIRHLLSLINEQLWSGHFDMWSEEGVLLYRNSLLLCGGATATPEQCEALLRLAVEACERYYPAVQFVLWAGKSAEDAIAAAMFETRGNA
ncbi:MAG: YbjN domain-containing protein [Parvibaculum sp.]|uniref:YbjN domain-containing protein n=1 Tax=Parvibaculum sp. TaxID=2024848 RepID=UPI003C738C8A